jgi:two-component system cell cycle sensor histidine kinase PleC
MFNNIKLFILFSFVFVVGVSYSVGLYYRHITMQDMTFLQREKAELLAKGYIEDIWNKHRPVLARLAQLDVEKWRNYREFHSFHKDTIAYFAHKPVEEVMIYLANGHFMISTQRTKMGEKYNISVTDIPFKEAKQGSIAHEISDKTKITFEDGSSGEGRLFITYVPIIIKHNTATEAAPPIDAILKIKSDVSNSLQKVMHFQIVIVLGITSLFLLLLLFLIFFSRRAEGIISKQHELNLELTAAAASAEAENRDKSMFLANISHELRTPLNAIIGFSDILYNSLEGRLELQHKEYLRDINSSGKHLLSLINDILEYSKAEAGKLEVDLSEIDGVKMVKNTIRLMIPRADESQVTLQEELPKESFILYTDAKKLKQVLLNLLSNSVKFTPPNGKVKVTAWHDVVRNRAIFVVTDTGIGIAPKDISKVMTPFGQVDSELSRRYEGTGLGLPLSKRLVELLGGTFKIESEVGVGTTITIDVPMRLERDKMVK